MKNTLALAVMMLLATAPIPAAAAAEQWQTAVGKMIIARQNYPRSAQLRGEEGVTMLSIALMADGKVSDVQVKQSSGSEILDREARSIVTGIGKLPTPPAGTSSLVIRIVWRLN